MPDRENNFAYLLIALIIFLVLLPILDDFDLAQGKFGRLIAFSTILVIGVWSLRGSELVFRIGMALAVFGMLFNLLSYKSDATAYEHISVTLISVFLILAMFSTLRQVLFQNTVDRNRLYGAVCAYLLLGVLWALAYASLASTSPTAFKGAVDVEGPVWNVQWIYFSFVTLTTLGYGDITPVSSTARVLAYSEAILGLFYMAVLVAGLVGAYISEQVQKRD
jgi:hypothetical protein